MTEIDQAVMTGPAPRWFNWYRFPLVPDWRFRPENEQNTWSLHFHWLIFRFWTMDSLALKLEIGIGDDQLEARVFLPYLIAGIYVPILPQMTMYRFWRKSPMSKKIEEKCRSRTVKEKIK